MDGITAVQKIFSGTGVKALVRPVQVVKCTAEVKAVVLVENHEPQEAGSKVGEQELVTVKVLATDGTGVETSVPIVLGTPAQGEKVEATLCGPAFNTGNEVVAEFATASHFFTVAKAHFTRGSSEVCLTGPVTPKGASDSEEVVTANGYALVVAYAIRLESGAAQDGGPLAAVVNGNAAVTIHDSRQRWVEVQRRHVELGKVNVLSLQAGSEQQN